MGPDDQLIVGLYIYEAFVRAQDCAAEKVGFSHEGGNKFVGRLFVNLPRCAFLYDAALWITPMMAADRTQTSNVCFP